MQGEGREGAEIGRVNRLAGACSSGLEKIVDLCMKVFWEVLRDEQTFCCTEGLL